MMRAWRLGLLLLGLAGCAANPEVPNAQAACPLIQLADMRLQSRGNLLFVQASIGDAPVTLLLDTGAERTLLTEAVVDRLGLPRDPQHATQTFGIGSPTVAWDAKLPLGLTLGGTRFPVNRVSVGRFGIDRIAGGSADGLLGADILLAFDIDLDLPAGRLTFYRARRACPDAGPPWSVPYVGLAGIAAKRDRLLVPIVLDGVAGMGVLDTGAQRSSMSLRLARRVGLEEAALADDQTVMAHGASPDRVAVRVHRFRELRVGPAVMHGPSLPVVPMPEGMGDALVGADFLHGRRVWLSFATRHMFVTPLANGAGIAAALR